MNPVSDLQDMAKSARTQPYHGQSVSGQSGKLARPINTIMSEITPYKDRIVISDDIPWEHLKDRIEKGQKFIVFGYCISLVAISLKRLSPPIFIENEQQFLKYKRKYNLISYLFGWWGFPWGPIFSLRYIRSNNRGGVDVTKDILLNLTEVDYKNKQVLVVKHDLLFNVPIGFDRKAFVKTIARDFDDDQEIKKIVVGLFLNTGHSEPYYIIGILAKSSFALYPDRFLLSLRKEFHKNVYFEFLDLEEDTDVGKKLEQQGELMFDRKEGFRAK